MVINLMVLYDVNIKSTGNPDDGFIDEDALFMDTLAHIDGVGCVMDMVSSHVEDIGGNHDWSKIKYFDLFKRDVMERLSTPDFKSREWYKVHVSCERHHLNTCKVDDVDLFDVLEMIVDCICAGKARSGCVDSKFLALDSNILLEAYWNTVRKLDDCIHCEK